MKRCALFVPALVYVWAMWVAFSSDIPPLHIMVLFLMSCIWAWAMWRRKPEWRYPPGFCHLCGYDLTGNVSGICPECGTAVIARDFKPAMSRSEPKALSSWIPRLIMLVVVLVLLWGTFKTFLRQ